MRILLTSILFFLVSIQTFGQCADCPPIEGTPASSVDSTSEFHSVNVATLCIDCDDDSLNALISCIDSMLCAYKDQVDTLLINETSITNQIDSLLTIIDSLQNIVDNWNYDYVVASDNTLDVTSQGDTLFNIIVDIDEVDVALMFGESYPCEFLPPISGYPIHEGWDYYTTYDQLGEYTWQGRGANFQMSILLGAPVAGEFGVLPAGDYVLHYEFGVDNVDDAVSFLAYFSGSGLGNYELIDSDYPQLTYSGSIPITMNSYAGSFQQISLNLATPGYANPVFTVSELRICGSVPDITPYESECFETFLTFTETIDTLIEFTCYWNSVSNINDCESRDGTIGCPEEPVIIYNPNVTVPGYNPNPYDPNEPYVVPKPKKEQLEQLNHGFGVVVAVASSLDNITLAITPKPPKTLYDKNINIEVKEVRYNYQVRDIEYDVLPGGTGAIYGNTDLSPTVAVIDYRYGDGARHIKLTMTVRMTVPAEVGDIPVVFQNGSRLTAVTRPDRYYDIPKPTGYSRTLYGWATNDTIWQTDSTNWATP